MTGLKNLCKAGVFFIVLTSFSMFGQRQFGGATLYTVRDEMATAPEETIDEVSEIGYLYIEAAGYSDGKFYGMTPKEFKMKLISLI